LTQDNKALARRFIQAWSAGGQDIVDELADPGIVVGYTHFPEPIRGAGNFKEVLRRTYASFPDLKVSVLDLMAEGDRVLVRWIYHGSHQQGDVLGAGPQGKQVSVAGMTVYRIAHGKVIEETGMVDNFSLGQQLGSIPVLGAEKGQMHDR
jgi:steroid delta-isomerase-like uncharacterized protein